MRVLIVTDFLPSATHRMLQLLEAAARDMPAGTAYTLKPHASFTPTPADYPSLRLRIAADSLAALLGDHDVAYASNMTSAAVDARLAGVPVVVMLDDTDLNVSPLRGQPDVRFVTSPAALADALRTAARVPAAPAGRGEFFFLDPELPRWQRLLTDAQQHAIPA